MNTARQFFNSYEFFFYDLLEFVGSEVLMDMSPYIVFVLFVALLLLREEFLLEIREFFLAAKQKRDPIFRGTQLYRWIEGLSPHYGGLNLAPNGPSALPDRKIYREFGHFIHDLWEEIQKSGGQIQKPLKAIKMLLRADLQRTRRERQVLQGAYGQLLFMIGLVWFYLMLFDRLVLVELPASFWLGSFLWQCFGVFLFQQLLRNKRKTLFEPLNELLGGLQKLNLIAFQGRLAAVALPQKSATIKGDYLRYYLQLENTLELWRTQGRASPESLDELREDLGFLAEDAQQRFLPWIRALSFLWAMVFVLPLLFAGSLFGLYKLAVV